MITEQIVSSTISYNNTNGNTNTQNVIGNTNLSGNVITEGNPFPIGVQQQIISENTLIDDINSSSKDFISINNTQPYIQKGPVVNPITTITITASDSPEVTNLIVNYLPPALTEEQLKILFSAYGPVESCKLMIDKVTGQSLGYGFVKYFKADDATKGIQALNGTALENKILKVSYARPASSDIQNSNVYISGLDVNISKPELDAIFSSYGKIIDSKILHDHRTGVSRGVGFVRYNSKAEAEASIAALNGTTLPGMNQPLFVKMADNFDEKNKKKGGGFSGSSGSGRGRGVHRFDPMGKNAAMDYYNRNPYAAEDYSMWAGMNMAQYPMPGMNTGMIPMVAPTMAGQTFCVFIYNLPPEADDALLYRLFGPYGGIASVKVVREPIQGKCKGFGFVNYMKYEDAQNAILGLNGAQLGQKFLQVSFKAAKGTM